MSARRWSQNANPVHEVGGSKGGKSTLRVCIQGDVGVNSKMLHPGVGMLIMPVLSRTQRNNAGNKRNLTIMLCLTIRSMLHHKAPKKSVPLWVSLTCGTSQFQVLS